MPSKEDLYKGFTIGEWEVLPGKGVLRRGDDEIRPEPKVFAVLVSLACRDGNLVTREDLINEVWDGRATTDEPINRCLSQLRGHLHDRRRPHQYVETLQRRGYRLMVPVELHEQSDSLGPSRTPSLRLWKYAAAIVAFGLLATALLILRPIGHDTESHSIAILPIENLSGDPANQYIVDGIKNVLARRLSEVPMLAIKNTRVRYDMELSEIAERLEVESVVTGAVQLQGTKLKVTYLVSRGEDNVTVGSGEVDGDVRSIFSLQERLAGAVLNELMGRSTPKLITLHTPDSEAYDSYMRGMYALEHRGEEGNLEKAIALFQESIRLDEYYGPAYLSLATAYALLPPYRQSPVSETDSLAIRMVELGVAVDDNIADAAGAVYGRVYHNEKKWLESEASYRRAVTARLVDSNAFNWYSRMLASVGRLDDALTQILAAAAIDPDNAVINSRTAIAYTWLGESEKAHEFFDRASSLGAKGVTTHLLPYGLLLIQDGRYEEAEKVAERATILAGTNPAWIEPVFAGFRDPERLDGALKALDQAAAAEEIEPVVNVTARTILGDVDGAMAIARRLVEPGELFEMDLLYTPEFQALREHPDFMPLLERLGVVDYWEETGCQFDGHKANCSGD